MPTDESRGIFQRLADPHDTVDCKCDVPPVEDLSIRHYSLAFKDFVLKTRRYWRVSEPALKTENRNILNYSIM